MSGFFDQFEQQADLEGDADEDEPEGEQPDWVGHPHAFLPGRSNAVATLFRTEAALLVLCCIDAYPSGLEFTLRLLTAKADRRAFAPPLHFGHFAETNSSGVRLGIEFADGRKWSSISARPPGVLAAEPNDVVVVNQGGGGGGRFWEMRFWLWPLPPDGPLTFHADWPSRDVPETVSTVDAFDLRALAQSAVKIDLQSPQ